MKKSQGDKLSVPLLVYLCLSVNELRKLGGSLRFCIDQLHAIGLFIFQSCFPVSKGSNFEQDPCVSNGNCANSTSDWKRKSHKKNKNLLELREKT